MPHETNTNNNSYLMLQSSNNILN